MSRLWQNGDLLPLRVLTEFELAYGRQRAFTKVEPQTVPLSAAREDMRKLEDTDRRGRIFVQFRRRCQPIPRHVDHEKIGSGFILQSGSAERRLRITISRPFAKQAKREAVSRRRDPSSPALRAIVTATTGFLPANQRIVLFLSQSPTKMYQTLSPGPPIVGGLQKAAIADAAQQKGDAIAKPLCDVKHGRADFLPPAARLPRFTVRIGKRSATRLFLIFHVWIRNRGVVSPRSDCAAQQCGCASEKIGYLSKEANDRERRSWDEWAFSRSGDKLFCGSRKFPFLEFSPIPS